MSFSFLHVILFLLDSLHKVANVIYRLLIKTICFDNANKFISQIFINYYKLVRNMIDIKHCVTHIHI